MNHPIDLLRQRGFIRQCTDEEGLAQRMGRESVCFYVGVDPTAASLHIGHLVPVYAMAHLHRAGHRPILLMGGGTARIGDPSGKTEMRPMLSTQEIKANIARIQPQLARLIDTDDEAVITANNADWLDGLAYIDFLRDIGRHFSVNRMLSFEAYKQRMEKGLSFLEFNYQLLQSYDFLELYRRHNCILQIGGDDQWGNIVAGVELIRRADGGEAYGLTMPLITRSDGKKMGKTEKGALFLDPRLTSPYDFYQYWRNVADDDVERFLLTFTFLDAAECRELGSVKGRAANESKARLAFEVTRLLHGAEEAEGAASAARAAFGGGPASPEAAPPPSGPPPAPGDSTPGANSNTPVTARRGIPRTRVPRNEFTRGLTAADLFARTDLCSSKSEARRLIQQGGARIDNQKIDNPDHLVPPPAPPDHEIILKAGKKRFHRIVIE